MGGSLGRPASRGSGVGMGAPLGRPGMPGGGGASLNTAVRVAERPVTQQGMAGMRSGPAGPGRQVQDKSFYLAEIRRKMTDLSQVVAEMEGDVQRIEGEQAQTQQLNRRGEELAHSLRELQGELAEYNIMLDKVGTDTDPGEVAGEAAAIEEANALLRKRVDAVFLEKTGLEQQTEAAEADVAAVYAGMEQRINELSADKRQQYYDLQEECAHLQQEVQGAEAELHGLRADEERLSQAVSSDPVRSQAYQLYQQVAELEARRRDLEEESARLNMDPAQKKQQLMAQIREGNAEVARLETGMKELGAEIRGLEQKLEATGAGGGGAAEAAGGAAADADGASAGEGAGGRGAPSLNDEEIDRFLSDFPQLMGGAQEQLDEKRAEVLDLLKMTSHATEARGHVPNKKEFRQMKDELKYTQKTVENSQRTNTQLQSELQERQEELNKINGLGSKIDAQVEELRGKETRQRAELSAFGRIGELEVVAEQEKARLQAMKRSLSDRKETSERVLKTLQEASDAKQAQLEDNTVQKEYARLEMQLRKRHQELFSLGEEVAQKEAAHNCKPLLLQAASLVEELNARAKRSAML